MIKKKFLLVLAATMCVCILPAANVSASPNEVPRGAHSEWQRLQETWEALPQREKNKLYKAREAIDKADCNFIDKAVESKLIEKELGDRMKDHIKSRTERMRKDGSFPVHRHSGRQAS